MANKPQNQAALTDAQKKAAEQILQQKREKFEKNRKTRRICLAVLIPVAVLACAFGLLYNAVFEDLFAYRRAERMLRNGQCAEAAEQFSSLGEYKDSAARKKEALFALGMQLYEAGDMETARRTFYGLFGYGESKTWVSRIDYEAAEKAVSSGDLIDAIQLFDRAGTYQDAEDRAAETRQNAYQQAVSMAEAGDACGALKLFLTIPELGDSRTYARQLAPIAARALTAGKGTIYAVCTDGTVRASGTNTYGQLDVNEWRGIIDVAAGERHSVGLRADGTVTAAGDNLYGQCDVGDWRGIQTIAAGYMHTVGVRADGTVAAVGDNVYGQCDVGDWRNITAVAAGHMHTVGLRADGTVVAAGSNDDGQCDVGDWRDIVMVAAGPYHTVGVRADGTVVATGDNVFGQCDLSEASDVIAVSTSERHTVVLRSDGTAASFGSEENEQHVLAPYTGIVAVLATDSEYSILLKNTGTMTVVGNNNSFAAASSWNQIGLPAVHPQ